MLVLSRKTGEKVVIGGGITVTVLVTEGNRVRLGFEAPDHVRILRKELDFWQAEAVGGANSISTSKDRTHQKLKATACSTPV